MGYVDASSIAVSSEGRLRPIATPRSAHPYNRSRELSATRRGSPFRHRSHSTRLARRRCRLRRRTDLGERDVAPLVPEVGEDVPEDTVAAVVGTATADEHLGSCNPTSPVRLQPRHRPSLTNRTTVSRLRRGRLGVIPPGRKSRAIPYRITRSPRPPARFDAPRGAILGSSGRMGNQWRSDRRLVRWVARRLPETHAPGVDRSDAHARTRPPRRYSPARIA